MPAATMPSARRLLVPALLLLTAMAAAAFWSPGSAGAAGATADFAVTGDRVAGSDLTFEDRSTGAAWVYWNFGDGSNSRDRNPVHSYTSPGTYRVAYSVCAAKNDCATERRDVNIAEGFLSPAQSVMADWTVGTATAGTAVTFEDRSAGPIAWVYWNFGDGTSSRDRSPSHAFAADGTYDVRLHVCASVDECDTAAKTVTVGAATASPTLEADYTASPTIAEVGQPVTFSDRSSGTIGWVYWNFGDGTSSRDRNPVHTFTAPGVYRVAYSVCTDSTLCDSHATQVTVNEGTLSPSTDTLPDMTLAFAPAPPAAGESVQFISRAGTDADGATVAGWDYRWNFGDGTRGSGPFPRHSFASAGRYRVALTVCVSADSCTPEVATIVDVSSTPVTPPGRIFVATNPNPAEAAAPLTVDIASPDVDILGTFFLWEPTGDFTAPGNPDRFVTVPNAAGTGRLTVAACYASPSLFCQLIERDVLVGPAGGGPVIDAPTDLDVRWTRFGQRLEWTSTSDTDGVQVWAGPTASSLSLVADYPPETRAVLVDDQSVVCFEVRPVSGSTTGPAGAICRADRADDLQLLDIESRIESDGRATVFLTVEQPHDSQLDVCWARADGAAPDPDVSGLDFSTAWYELVDGGEQKRVVSIGIRRLVADANYQIAVQPGSGAAGPQPSCAVAPGIDAFSTTVRTTAAAGSAGPAFVTYPSQPVAGEPVTFLDSTTVRPLSGTWDFGDGSGTISRARRTHTYRDAGSYQVTMLRCGTCDPLVQTVTVAPAGTAVSDNGLVAPANLDYTGWRAHPAELIWDDTNTDEDGYHVYITEAGPFFGNIGLRVDLPADVERVSFTDNPIGSFDRICYEVRAVRNGVVGPAASRCDTRTGGELIELSATPAGDGEIRVDIVADVDNTSRFMIWSDKEPFCGELLQIDREDYEYELADAENQVRAYTGVIPNLVSGDSYQVTVFMDIINGPGPCFGGTTATGTAG